MPTFAEFAERYPKEEAETKLKPGTVVNYRIHLRKHAWPMTESPPNKNRSDTEDENVSGQRQDRPPFEGRGCLPIRLIS
jgi:hypothetical protein